MESFARIEPKRVRLTGKVTDNLQTEVKIIPVEKYPFRITSVKARDSRFIDWSLKRINEGSSYYYLLKVENRMKSPGHYFSVLELNTDSPLRPVLKVWVIGNIFSE